MSKTSKSEPVTPKKVPSNMQPAVSKQVMGDALEERKIKTQRDSANYLAAKLEASLSMGVPSQVSTNGGLAVSETGSFLDSGGNQVKRTLENGSSSAKINDGASSLAKTSDRAEFVESEKSSICRGSTSTDVSDESTCSSFSNAIKKPHKANDIHWEAIQAVRARDSVFGLGHFRLLKKLGCGDIGSVYLSELSGTKCYFAMKVMDKASLANPKKLLRAQTEREILQCLDHPFLPTLYTHFETEKYSCLVMEFCPGGDLHTLRQPGKYFSEQAVKFYVAEVLLAMEYLHMLGIVYRDLKPENVLVRDDGHIMLSDFDLSLRCAVSPTLVKSSVPESEALRKTLLTVCSQPALNPHVFSHHVRCLLHVSPLVSFQVNPRKTENSRMKWEIKSVHSQNLLLSQPMLAQCHLSGLTSIWHPKLSKVKAMAVLLIGGLSVDSCMNYCSVRLLSRDQGIEPLYTMLSVNHLDSRSPQLSASPLEISLGAY